MKEKRNWPALIKEQAISGKTIKAFCAELGIHPNSFYKNKKRHSGQDLIEVPVPQPRSVPTSSIILRAGQYSLVISPGFDPSTLKALLKALDEVGK